MADRLEFDVALDATQAQAQIRQLTSELEAGLRAAGQGFSTTLDFSQAIASARVLSDTLTSGLTSASDAFNQSLNFDAAATAAQTVSDALVIDPTPIQDISLALGEASVEAASIADAGQIDSTPAATLADELSKGADDATNLASAVQEASQAAAETSLNARDLAGNMAEASTSSGELAQTLGESANAGDRSREASDGVANAAHRAKEGHKASNEELEKGVNIAERIKQKFEEITGRNIEALGPFAKTFESIAEGFGKVSLGTEIVGGGLVAGLAAITAAGERVEGSLNVITRTTGLTGEALDAAGESFSRVAVQSERAPQEMAKVFSLLQGNTKATGQSLEDLTLSTDKFLKATGGSASDVRPLTQAAAALGVEAQGIPLLMDQMAAASARFGTSISTLIPAVRQTAPALKAFGFSPGQIVGLNAELESVGLPLRRISNGFVTINKLAQQQGITSSDFFGKMIEDIKKADSAQSALTATRGIFSGTAATQFVAAVRDGRISMEKLDEVLADAPGKSKEMAESLTTVGDVLKRFATVLTFSLGREGGGLSAIDSLKEILISLIPTVTKIGEAVGSLRPAFQGLAEGAIGPVVIAFKVFGDVLGRFGSVIGKIPDGVKEFVGILLVMRTLFALDLSQKLIGGVLDFGKSLRTLVGADDTLARIKKGLGNIKEGAGDDLKSAVRKIIGAKEEEKAATLDAEDVKTAAVVAGGEARVVAVDGEATQITSLVAQFNGETLAATIQGQEAQTAAVEFGAAARLAILEGGGGAVSALQLQRVEDEALLTAHEARMTIIKEEGALARELIVEGEQTTETEALVLGGGEQVIAAEATEAGLTAAKVAGVAERKAVGIGGAATGAGGGLVQGAEAAGAGALAKAAVPAAEEAAGGLLASVGGAIPVIGTVIAAAGAVGLKLLTDAQKKNKEEAAAAAKEQKVLAGAIGETSLATDAGLKKLEERIAKGGAGGIISDATRSALADAHVSIETFSKEIQAAVRDDKFNVKAHVAFDVIGGIAGLQKVRDSFQNDASKFGGSIRSSLDQAIREGTPEALDKVLGDKTIADRFNKIFHIDLGTIKNEAKAAADAARKEQEDALRAFEDSDPRAKKAADDVRAVAGAHQDAADILAKAVPVFQQAKLAEEGLGGVSLEQAGKATELADAYDKLHPAISDVAAAQRDNVDAVIAVNDAMADGNLSRAEAVKIGLELGVSEETLTAIEKKYQEELANAPGNSFAAARGVIAYNQAITAGKTPLQAQAEAMRVSRLSWDQVKDGADKSAKAVALFDEPVKATAKSMSAVVRGFADGKKASDVFNDAVSAAGDNVDDAARAFQEFKDGTDNLGKSLGKLVPSLQDIAKETGTKLFPDPPKDAKPDQAAETKKEIEATRGLTAERKAAFDQQLAIARATRQRGIDTIPGFDATQIDAVIADLEKSKAHLDDVQSGVEKDIGKSQGLIDKAPQSMEALLTQSEAATRAAAADSAAFAELARQGFDDTVKFILDPANGFSPAEQSKLLHDFEHATPEEKTALERHQEELTKAKKDLADQIPKDAATIFGADPLFVQQQDNLGVTLGEAVAKGVPKGIDTPENKGIVRNAIVAIFGEGLGDEIMARILSRQKPRLQQPEFPVDPGRTLTIDPQEVKNLQATQSQQTADLGTFSSLATPSAASAGDAMAAAASKAFRDHPLQAQDIGTYASLLEPTLVATGKSAADKSRDALGAQWQAAPLPITAFAGLTVNVPSAADTAGISGGINFVGGFIAGLTDPASDPALFNAAASVVGKARTAVDAAQQSGSPSRLMMKRGQWFVEGLAQGIDAHAHKATASAAKMTDALTGMIGGTMGSPQILASVTATGPDQVSMGDGPGVDRIVRAIAGNRPVHPNARRRLPFGGGNG